MSIINDYKCSTSLIFFQYIISFIIEYLCHYLRICHSFYINIWNILFCKILIIKNCSIMQKHKFYFFIWCNYYGLCSTKINSTNRCFSAMNKSYLRFFCFIENINIFKSICKILLFSYSIIICTINEDSTRISTTSVIDNS